MPPPPPQKIQQPNIVEVVDEEVIEEEIKVDFDIEITTDEVMEEVDYSALEIEVPEEKADEVFSIVETMPAPQGGMQEFMKFLHSNIKYPNKALNAKVQGKVFVQFIVNPDGKLSDFEVVKGIGMGCDEEAVRVLQAAPAWSPGKQRGKPVHVKMVLPVNFVYKSR